MHDSGIDSGDMALLGETALSRSHAEAPLRADVFAADEFGADPGWADSPQPQSEPDSLDTAIPILYDSVPDDPPSRFEGLKRLQKRFSWALPVLGFASGWASFILVQRDAGLARVIALVALAGWAWLLVYPLVMKWIKRSRRLEVASFIPDFVTQSIQQEILFFTLPFLFAATHLADPGQVAATALIILAATVSTIDPLYYRYIACSRLSSLAFHSLCSFLAALIILPIVFKLPLEKSLVVALGFVIAWLFIAVPAILMSKRDWVVRVGLVLGMTAVPLLIWTFRDSIPPAGIFVTSATITNEVHQHEPGARIQRISVSELHRQGIYTHAAIKAPHGLSQDIVFQWTHNGIAERIPSTILGGREAGYRNYSVKRNFPLDPTGLWEVDILTSQGQLIERLSFVVD